MTPAAQAPDPTPLAEIYGETLAEVRHRLDCDLTGLLFFGSCLSPATRRPTSIPDLVAFVGDLDGALRRLEAGSLARWVAPILPPITLAFRSRGGAPLAKLTLVEPAVATREIAALRDLYLAGRLSKRTELVWSSCPGEIERLVDQAAAAVADLALLGMPRRQPIAAAVERCVTISYASEPRPERPEKLRALFATFAHFYTARFTPLVEAAAARRGLALVGGDLVDERDDQVRAAEARALARLLRRSRLRTMARWPKMALVYRGWLPYLIGKLRRARLS